MFKSIPVCFISIFCSRLCVCAFAGGPHRGDPQQQRSDLLQDLPGGLLL